MTNPPPNEVPKYSVRRRFGECGDALDGSTSWQVIGTGGLLCENMSQDEARDVAAAMNSRDLLFAALAALRHDAVALVKNHGRIRDNYFENSLKLADAALEAAKP